MLEFLASTMAVTLIALVIAGGIALLHGWRRWRMPLSRSARGAPHNNAPGKLEGCMCNWCRGGRMTAVQPTVVPPEITKDTDPRTEITIDVLGGPTPQSRDVLIQTSVMAIYVPRTLSWDTEERMGLDLPPYATTMYVTAVIAKAPGLFSTGGISMRVLGFPVRVGAGDGFRLILGPTLIQISEGDTMGVAGFDASKYLDFGITDSIVLGSDTPATSEPEQVVKPQPEPPPKRLVTIDWKEGEQ